MGNCKICGTPKRAFMQAKFVCLHCDELLFDMEIEIDGKPGKKPAVVPVPAETKAKSKVIRLVDKKKDVKETQAKEELELDTKEEDTDKTKKAA